MKMKRYKAQTSNGIIEVDTLEEAASRCMTATYWIKEQIKRRVDPVKALGDAELLVAICKERLGAGRMK